jgi:pyruvate carboxylase
VKTNKSFLLHVLENEQFLDGVVDTGFIAQNPYLLAPLKEQDRAQKLLQYIGEITVNGPPKELGAVGAPPSSVDPIIPQIKPPSEKTSKKSLKKIFDDEGPEAFAKAVRNNEGKVIVWSGLLPYISFLEITLVNDSHSSFISSLSMFQAFC